MRERTTARAALVLWGILGFAGAAWTIATHGRMAARLAGQPPLARGALAVGQSDWPLATAGRVLFRKQVASGQASSAALGLAWQWVLTHRPEGPPSARIHLNLPKSVLYYYTTFYWWPYPVRVNPVPGLVKNDATLAAHNVRLPRDRFAPTLRPLGYTHVLDAGGPDSVELVPLP